MSDDDFDLSFSDVGVSSIANTGLAAIDEDSSLHVDIAASGEDTSLADIGDDTSLADIGLESGEDTSLHVGIAASGEDTSLEAISEEAAYQHRVANRKWHSDQSQVCEPAAGSYAVVAASLAGRTFRTLNVASDCSGIEAPMFAHQSVSRVAESHGMDVRFHHVFSSETLDNKDALLFHKHNHSPDVFYSDLFSRSKHGGPYIWKRDGIIADALDLVPLPKPGHIDIYDAGSDCKKFSTRSSDKTLEQPLTWAAMCDPNVDTSTRMLLKSLWTVHVTRPRVWRVENVNGAPMERVILFVQTWIGGYSMLLVRGDGADFLGFTERFRQYLVGVTAGCMLLDFSEWRVSLLAMRSPREGTKVLQHLLARDSHEVLAEFSQIVESHVSLTGNESTAKTGADKEFLKWRAEHAAALECLTSQGRTVPTRRSTSVAAHAWADFYVPREVDLLRLTSTFAYGVLGRKEDDHIFIDMLNDHLNAHAFWVCSAKND
jgi:hypothetical protein